MLKMCTVFYVLLMIQLSYAENFAVTTVAVGENVTLSCKRHAAGIVGNLFWIRLIPGNMPEILGKTFTFDYDRLNTNSRIATKQEPGIFVLHIAQTTLSDTGFYFCFKSHELNLTFLNGTFLRIKGPELDVTAVFQGSLSDTVRKGDSVSLQCSVISKSEKKTCSEERKVFWFRDSSAEYFPSLIYAQNEGDGECEPNPETHSGQSCVFNFIKKNINFSDAGTYYCALAACGTVVFGNGTKLEFEDINIINSQWNSTLLFLLTVTSGLMLVVAALLVCLIRRKSCKFCKGSEFLSRNNEAVCEEQQNQQKKEDSLVYSSAVFTQRKAGQAGRVKARRKEETIYSDVRTFDKD